MKGTGIVSETYSWTVPKDYAHGPSWEIVPFRAEDYLGNQRLGGVGLASLVLRIERPLWVYDARVHVRACPRGTAIPVDDGDPSPIPLDFPLFTLEFQPPAGISVGETGGYYRSGTGSSVEIEVQVEPTVPGWTYPVPFTARQCDFRTAEL